MSAALAESSAPVGSSASRSGVPPMSAQARATRSLFAAAHRTGDAIGELVDAEGAFETVRIRAGDASGVAPLR